jgi:epoxyqueuosine reductase
VTSLQSLKLELIGACRTAGLHRIGFARAGPFPEALDALIERKGNGLAGSLGFTYSTPELAADPTASFPWAATLVVGARSYVPESGSPGPAIPGTGRISRAAASHNYAPLRAALDVVGDLLRKAGYRAEVLCDDHRLMDRAAAVRAGIGWWGKNTMVLVPGLGPWVLLGSVVTDAVIEPDEVTARDCGVCSACLPACPTGALITPGVLDARLCLAAWAQTPGVVPSGIREAMGDRIYGCDDCLDACPPGTRVLRSASSQRGRVDLAELLLADDQTLLERFGHWFLPDRDPRIIRRNALIAAGNSGHAPLVALVASYTGHPDWVLRVHAIWAIRQLGGQSATTEAVFAHRDRHETDSRVRAELAHSPIGK